MATFIALISETQQGEKHIGESIGRASAFRKEATEIGVQVKDVYWTLGEYDGVLIFDAPDAGAAAAAMCKLNAKGAVRTHTMQAFSAEDMEAILKRVQ
jgi:uncharacterized protein with GYD domain